MNHSVKFSNTNTPSIIQTELMCSIVLHPTPFVLFFLLYCVVWCFFISNVMEGISVDSRVIECGKNVGNVLFWCVLNQNGEVLCSCGMSVVLCWLGVCWAGVTVLSSLMGVDHGRKSTVFGRFGVWNYTIDSVYWLLLYGSYLNPCNCNTWY